MSSPRIAVVGANGQVGAEVCLMLSNQPDIEVVPVARNERGSAFLRWMGLPCRHGDIGMSDRAYALIGDCDLILNFALSGARHKRARRENARLIENCARYAKNGARIVYFSTQNVYGSANPGSLFRWRGFYAREKLRCEADARAAGRRHSHSIWIFRLGHVCGDLQNLTSLVRKLVERGEIRLANGGLHPSNCTHVCAIVDVALALLRNSGPGGTFDLVNNPQWTWREVYAREADRVGLPLSVRSVPSRQRPGIASTLSRAFRTAFGTISPAAISELGRRMVSVLPERAAARIHVAYLRRKAAAEIFRYENRPASHEASDWRPVPGLYYAHMRNTREIIDKPEFVVRRESRNRIEPLQLPDAEITNPAGQP